ncbi:uncharacterized protein TRAVEDRAFT_32438 [Trametes versicolor FP-101664 SS1]|uniref:Uncharacterized protein n=1 Tax=Trametes versicolor (strain FP-101664) TaxID=717944 RepID=R7S7G0_TRAVS|nr:uncharacterized protein TRAVEDRAFT_32438 [Trametes versicolor FP-101664 SS1]EIW51547.1 hypothetical protein TRAVEDRAFT_32438 [Trametes versicolor FP-101664 SS1]
MAIAPASTSTLGFFPLTARHAARTLFPAHTLYSASGPAASPRPIPSNNFPIP